MSQPVRAALLAGLLILSPAAFANAQDVSAKPAAAEQPTILVTSVVPGFVGKDGTINGAVVQFDLLNADLQKALSGQSTRLVIDIDCAGEKIRARNMIVYKDPKQGGAAAEVRIKDDWESYHGGAYLADVARSICHQDGKAEMAKAAPKPAQGAPLLARAPIPSAKSDSSIGRPGQPTRSIQFVSSASESEVRADIEKLKTKIGPQIGNAHFSVREALVKGVKHYRGRLGTFATSAEAKQFCSRIIELKFQCLLISDTE